MSSGRRIPAAVAVLVLLLAAGVTVALHRRHDATPGALEAALPQLISFVERTRGLRFVTRPKVELLSDDRFEQLLEEDDDPTAAAAQRADDEAYAGLLRALGLLEGPVDLQSVADDEASDVVGFYDSQTKIVYARADHPIAYLKDVVVHELTHALDDQHFGIDKETADDDAASAYDALIEGSAMVVENRWYDSRPVSEQDTIDAEDSGGTPAEGASGTAQADASDVYGALADFPYEIGPDFVQALLDDGGRARLDAAFADPPTTTEQVTHPDRYLAHEGARPVPEPAADGAVADHGVLGELVLGLVLDSAVSHDAALEAAAGWGGDRYVTWTAGAQTCVRWNIVMDTDRDTDQLLAALRSWTVSHRQATVTGTTPVVLTNCA